MDDWVRKFRATRTAPGTPGVVIPVDAERHAEAERRAGGVLLLPAVVAHLRDISARTGIPFE